MSSRSAITLVVACALTVMLPDQGAAQEVSVLAADLFVPDAKAPAPSGPRITLAEAVQLTIRHQPRIVQAAQAARIAAGLHRAERGVFDLAVRTGVGFEYTQQPVLPFLLDAEEQKRRVLDVIADSFTDLNVAMRDAIAGLHPDPPPCPFDIDLDTGAILFALPPGVNRQPGLLTFDLVEQVEQALQGGRELPLSPTGDLEDMLSGFRDLCSQQLNGSLEQRLLDRLFRRINLAGDLGLEGALISGSQALNETFPLLEEISEAVATRARLGLERLGPLPEDQFRRSFSLSAGFTKPFRSGLTVSGSLLVQSEEENYRDKIMDPTHGGMGLPPRFPSHASLALDIPLGNGFGSTAVAGPERSAASTSVARTEQMRHTVAEEVYRTVLAYLNLVAAHESVRLLEESAARHADYVKLTAQLVTAEELPKIDLARAQARAASLSSSLREARTALAEARISLVEAAGLDVDTLDDTPLASEAFAEPPSGAPVLDDLLRLASSRRRDTRALERVREASDALARAARANLRRTFTFNLSGGFSNLYESPFPRFLPDEEDPIYSDFEPLPERDSPARYYSPRGVYRSMLGRWEPFVVAQLTVSFPFGNNRAKGRLAQAEATLRSAEIELADTERVIRQNVVEVRNTMQTTREAVEHYREVVENVLETRDGSRQLFEAGEITLIDALVTEDEATTDQLTLVRQLQLYFSTLARLKYEAGEIVSFANEGTDAEAVQFSATDFVSLP
ncbi:MAG: hypothetical protein GEV06_14130 [Luteitalea sp.]|nr:hypothetical protein [Luteitalea sp.]